ncbi:hypothetical protein D3C86_1811210 [compost metagenome]
MRAVSLRTVRPMKTRMHSSAEIGQPDSLSMVHSTVLVMVSLSTSTPSQSNRMASNCIACAGAWPAFP